MGCAKEEKAKREFTDSELYEAYCGGCHISPDIRSLPKAIWREGVLPEMAMRMGVSSENPYKNLSMEEANAVAQTGVYPEKPTIPKEYWQRLHDYILATAPDTQARIVPKTALPLSQFKPKPINIDNRSGSHIISLRFSEKENLIRAFTLQNRLFEYDYKTDQKLVRGIAQPVVSYSQIEDTEFFTEIGILNPSELAKGKLQSLKAKKLTLIQNQLHRPVHTLAQDINGDGTIEFVICEFGHLTGQVLLLKQKEDGTFDRDILLKVPGAIRTIAEDFNRDSKLDLAILVSQGDEGVYIFYQKEDLQFERKRVLRFSPIYGTSWFDLVDYDNDGDQDIITVNGDNADYSIIEKPFHGIRLFIFEQKYFYPINGATRFIAEDFDQDQDIDLAVVAAFPDYAHYPERAFIYLENQNSNSYAFHTFTLKEEATWGRWLLIEGGDVDSDGDIDLILSSFTYVFNPQPPQHITQKWKSHNLDLLVLENKLRD